MKLVYIKDENTLWLIKSEISNSAGNLCLHLIGNLNHFIGAVLGNNGYVRNRDNEFSAKSIPRKELISEIEKTIDVVNKTLNNLSEEDFEKGFPFRKSWKNCKNGFYAFSFVNTFQLSLRSNKLSQKIDIEIF